MENNENDKPRESGEEIKLVDSGNEKKIHESMLYEKIGCIIAVFIPIAATLFAIYSAVRMPAIQMSKYGSIRSPYDATIIRHGSKEQPQPPGHDGK